MELIAKSKSDLIRHYKNICGNKNYKYDIGDLWPPACAEIRDPALFEKIPFSISHESIRCFDIGCLKLNWLDAEDGKSIIKAIGMDDLQVEPISYSESRAAFIEAGVKQFEDVCRNELEFISEFTSSIVWLTPKSATSSFGNASFYMVPHTTLLSDGSLFFIPPFKQIPREFGGFGFIENLYHEALHHQVHAHCAFTKTNYCIDGIDAFSHILSFPKRSDRTFTFFQAINACHVYRELTNFRQRVLVSLEKNASKSSESLSWLHEAKNEAFLMWKEFASELFKERDKFIQPWQDFIVAWKQEAEVLSAKSSYPMTDLAGN
ncbi:hypothetical protein [Paludibacterium purpuratum]|uniref:HEXXH motif-containing protein n=1 Tax=Paludibacterium purpuratum TaxID=1144873 RepID=A0A4R7B4Z5_9NEIS|nr:hypothetical protein [Paludibacterium purpuratum]TDR79724.1 hypothetical protein DFP86_10788 [Paludibacterium purpuratum]